MISRAHLAALFLIPLLGCQKQDQTAQTTPPTAPSTPTPSNPSGNASTSTTQPATLPDSLKNTAYDYYGLAQTEPQKAVIRVDGKSYSGSHILKLLSVNGAAATYLETLTGTPQGDQSQTISLSSDGVYVESTDPETLKTPHVLELPTKLEPGFTWKSHVEFTAVGKDVVIDRTCRIVGPQTLTLKSGNVETLYVESSGSGKYENDPATTKDQWWYAKGKGPVKWVETLTIGGKAHMTETVETDLEG
jgi:hypothetical protein